MNSTRKKRPRTSPEPSTSRVRRDVAIVILFGTVAMFSTVNIGVGKFLDTFQADGVHWDLPIQATPITAAGLTAYGSEGPLPAQELRGTAHSLNVIVPDLGAFPSFAAGAAIVVATVTALAVIVCIGGLALQFRRGEFFTPRAVRLIRASVRTGILGVTLSYILGGISGNAVAAALSVRTQGNGAHATNIVPIVFFVVVATVLIDFALHRAVKLERETEGLV